MNLANTLLRKQAGRCIPGLDILSHLAYGTVRQHIPSDIQATRREVVGQWWRK